MFRVNTNTKWVAAGIMLLLSTFNMGCNLFGALDTPEDDTELREKALVLMDENKCMDAAKLFQGKTTLTDEGYHILGWAQMCAGGASITQVATYLYSYSTSTQDLKIIGSLANKLIPSADSKVTSFSNAVTTFNQIQDSKTRGLDVTLANLVKAAAVVAKYSTSSGDTNLVTRADISSSCTSDCTTCTAGLSNTDATTIRSSITSATSAVASVGGSLGSVSDLIARLNSQAGAADQATRCMVYYQFFDN